MKAVILYRADSEDSRAVEEFVREFSRRTNRDIEQVDVDSIEGTRMAELYDIMRHPAVLVTKDDGALVKSWLGVPLPLVNDVDGYLVQQ